jgi:gliding motility-associated-like protein
MHFHLNRYPLQRKLYLSLIIGFFIAFSAKSQAPVAHITPSSTSGCVPLVVSFVDASTNSPTSRVWTFPGGSPPTSTAATQIVVFNAPGNYTVTLASTNASGTGDTSVVIAVYPSPVADFSADAVTGCFPKTINFTDASNPGAGATITNWTYDFGDGIISSGIQNPSHLYHFGGNFPVTEFVQNSFGCSGSAAIKTISGYITLVGGVYPYFTDSVSAACKPPATAFFNNQTTGPGTLSYSWSFGDGGTSTQATPTHIYMSAGTYNVTVIATSSLGCGDTSSIVPVTITANANSSSFSVPGAVCVGLPFSIQNTSTPSPNSSVWSYSDGSKNDSTINTTHAFPAAGTYTITLQNQFSSCGDSTSKSVQAVTAPVPGFTSSDSVSCKPSLTVNFLDQSVNANSWSWNFGDGSAPSTLASPFHTYTKYGQYSVTLTVSSAAGCNSVLTKTNYIKIVAPVITITNLPDYGCAPLTYAPKYVTNVVDGISNIHWDFGNGTTFDGLNPPPVVYTSGKYKVTATLTTLGGCTASYSDSVKAGTIKPTAAFTATPLTACIGQPIQFTDQSTGNPNQWFWTFGDGSSDSLQNPSYSYTKPGTFSVQLTAYNDGCFDLLLKTNYIVVNPPLAGFTAKYNCGAKNEYTFTDTSKGATTYDWDFGDGSPHYSGPTPPLHVYLPVPANYIVTQTVSAGGCTNSKTMPISVLQGTTINTSANPVCSNTVVSIFTTHPSNIVSYTFFFGDGQSAGSGSGVTSHSYASPNDYFIKVKTIDAFGCADSSLPYTMHISGPTAAFTAPVTQSCGALTANFTDQSVPKGAAIASWFWDFGDGTTSTSQNPTHNYALKGLYPVKLKVVDANGCSDSIVKSNYIVVSIPQVNFTSLDTMTCPGKPVKFTNTSNGGFNPTYTWDFGNGSTSTATNPPLQFYAATGMYTVTLTGTDKYGCTLSATKTNYVNVDVPVASFTISDTFSSCPPLIDTFTFTGHYAKSLIYTFGDGASSDTGNTYHLYGQPGDYYPSLTVTSPGNCIVNSPPQHIHIDGPLGQFTYSPETSCDSMLVTLKVTTANVTRFVWFYGDNTVLPDTTTTPLITHEYDVPGHYLPLVILTDVTGCSLIKYGTDSILVDHIQKASFTMNKSVLCDNGNVLFADNSTLSTGTVISNYFWDFGDGTTASGMIPNPTHFFGNTGLDTVRLVISSVNGCIDSTKAVIKVQASPQVDIAGVVSQCVPATLNFQGTVLVPDTSALGWAWDFKNGQTSNLQNPAPQLYTKAGLYTVSLIATNSSGCTDEADADLYIYPIPDIFAGADTTICLGQALQLQASGGANYTWLPPASSSLNNPSISNPVASPTVTTSYIVNGFSTYGCQAFDTIDVTVNQPVTLTVNGPDSVCIGQTVQLTASGAVFYAWTPTAGLSNPAIPNPVATPSVTTNYQVVGSDSKYCFNDTKFINVTVFNYPTVNLGPDVTIPVGTSYQISGTGSPDIVSMSWTPSAGLSCGNCLTPLATPVKTTDYVATVVNNGGCASSDSLKITVVCNGSNFFIPNTFSPNGDGHNDVFYVQGVGLNVIPSITIFNRWGQIVFQKTNFTPNDPAVGWDGKVDGKPAPSDVYVYTIEILCNNSTLIPYHGNVTLIR